MSTPGNSRATVYNLELLGLLQGNGCSYMQNPAPGVPTLWWPVAPTVHTSLARKQGTSLWAPCRCLLSSCAFPKSWLFIHYKNLEKQKSMVALYINGNWISKKLSNFVKVARLLTQSFYCSAWKISQIEWYKCKTGWNLKDYINPGQEIHRNMTRTHGNSWPSSGLRDTWW